MPSRKRGNVRRKSRSTSAVSTVESSACPRPASRYVDRGTAWIVSSIRACNAALDATICPRVSSTGRAGVVGDAAARFGHDERAGGDVPGVQLLLPEPVEAPGRDVAEIERRRPEPPHRARRSRNAPKHVDLLLPAAARVVRKPRDQQRVDRADRSTSRRAAVR